MRLPAWLRHERNAAHETDARLILEANVLETYVRAGFTHDSAIRAIRNNDLRYLQKRAGA